MEWEEDSGRRMGGRRMRWQDSVAGGQGGRRTGWQEDTVTGGHSDRRMEWQEDRVAGEWGGRRMRWQEDEVAGEQGDSRIGWQEDTVTGGQCGRRMGWQEDRVAGGWGAGTEVPSHPTEAPRPGRVAQAGTGWGSQHHRFPGSRNSWWRCEGWQNNQLHFQRWDEGAALGWRQWISVLGRMSYPRFLRMEMCRFHPWRCRTHLAVRQ